MSAPAPFGRSPARLPPQLEARLSSSLEAELARPVRPWWRDAVAFVGVTLALFVVGCFLFQRSVSPLALGAGVWSQSLALLAASLVAGVAGLAPWPQRTSRPLVLGALVAGTVLVTQVVSMELAPFTPKLGCFVWELVASLVPAGVAIVAARHYAPRLSRAMVLGWAAGTLSLAVMQLKCPHRDVGHLLLFHVLPLVLVVAATVLVRRRVATTSYAP
ncbi:MAG: NrsF family protein [Myxococcaceae bacterium]|nr:NrsF family protein [Myxococcaceae bacterium]